MRILRHTFTSDNNNPHPKEELIVEGPLGTMDHMYDGSGLHKIFLHTGPKSDGVIVELSQAEWERVWQ